MKKTVVFEFPDDFQFPEKCGDKCSGCPFCVVDDCENMCSITGDSPFGILRLEHLKGKIKHPAHPDCPFYDGSDTVNYDEC